MKGAFNIEIRRNGKLLKHNFNNRILKSGLEFQEKYSVNNSTDSIITHLLLGSVHSDVNASTTAMTTTPVAAVPYIDYIKPDFLDEKSSLFKNELVFKFEPTETIIVKQLATGRKNVTVIGGIESVSYDYFSLANVLENGELGEIKLYPGDSLTITYTLLVNIAVNFSKTYAAADVAWNILKANPNWHLCGFNRRMQVAKETLVSYWEVELNPWVYEKNLSVNTNVARYFYSRIMWQLPTGMTREQAVANERLKRTLDFGGAVPIWNNNGGPHIYDIGGKLSMEGTTSSLYQSSPINELDRYYITDLIGKELPVVSNITSQLLPAKVKPPVALVIKTSPLSMVLIKSGNTVLKSTQSTEYGFGTGNMGRSDKFGNYKFILSQSEATLLDKTKPITAIVINHTGYVESEPFYLELPKYNCYGKLNKAQYLPDGKFDLTIEISAWDWDSPTDWRPQYVTDVSLEREGSEKIVRWTQQGSYGPDTYSPALVMNVKLTPEEDVDFLDGSWKVVIKSRFISTVSYEIPLEKSVVTTPNNFFTNGNGYPLVTSPNTRTSGIGEIAYSKLTITKK